MRIEELCLYKAYDIGDASHKKEAQEIMSIKDKLKNILEPLVRKHKNKACNKNRKYEEIEVPLEEILSACNVKESFYYDYFRSFYNLSDLDCIQLSITGGYVRNFLLSSNAKTDIDVVINNHLVPQFIAFLYKLKSNITEKVLEYDFCDNTMHLLPYVYTYVHIVDDQAHIMVDPAVFDFTINCACISSINGHVYAPAATIHDIEHGIIRSTAQIIRGLDITHVIRISLAIRAIRFALKYNMKIHDMLYKAIKLLFFLQNERNTIDDYQIYHAIKHLYDDPEDLREEIFSTLKWLNMFETRQFANFDEYFNYIKNRYEQNPREGRLISGIDFSY